MVQLVTLHVNGVDYPLALDTRTTLVDALRDHLGLKGVKKSCDEGECGACTVLLDGNAIASCTYLAVEAEGHDIVTIEGLAKDGVLHPLQQAFIDCFAVQCGFCTPGMILAAVAMLNHNPDPTEEEVRDTLRGNICRCTGYTKIIDAIMQAKEVLKMQAAGIERKEAVATVTDPEYIPGPIAQCGGGSPDPEYIPGPIAQCGGES